MIKEICSLWNRTYVNLFKKGTTIKTNELNNREHVFEQVFVHCDWQFSFCDEVESYVAHSGVAKLFIALMTCCNSAWL